MLLKVQVRVYSVNIYWAITNKSSYTSIFTTVYRCKMNEVLLHLVLYSVFSYVATYLSWLDTCGDKHID